MREDKKTERVLSSDKSSMYHEDSEDENKDTTFTERRWDLIENSLQRSIAEDLETELEIQQEEVKKEEQIKKLDIDREMNI